MHTYHLTLLLSFLLFPLWLAAQAERPDTSWQLSLLMSYRSQPFTNYTFSLSAADTIPLRRPVPRFGQFGNASVLDYETPAGDSVTYYLDERSRQYVRAAEGRRIGFELRADRQWPSGLLMAYGIRFIREVTEGPPRELPTEFSDYTFSAYREARTIGGLTGSFGYVWRKSRIQPYALLQIQMSVDHTRRDRPGIRYFPRYGETVPFISELVDAHLSNTIFDFDMVLLAGVTYALTPRFALGIESRLVPAFDERYYLAAQVRYRLSGY